MMSQKTEENNAKTIKQSVQIKEPATSQETKGTGKSTQSSITSTRDPELRQDGDSNPVSVVEISPESMPFNSHVQQDIEEKRLRGMAGLAVILGQLVAYFSDRSDIDDLDVLSFSLHHLFCRVDFLYQETLPCLNNYTHSQPARQTLSDEIAHRQRIWTQLQAINRTLDRMEPLCHLLSDAAECILDAFDATSERAQTAKNANAAETEEDSLFITSEEHWEQGFTALTQSLLSWQQNQRNLTSFATQFAQLLATTPTITQLDTAFATLLDSAGAIFGDILPGFRAISLGDDTAIAALLFDLMQQSDRLLQQLETTLEPLNALIKHFATGAALF